MMLFSILNVIGLLLCCSSLSWLFESGLLETVGCGQKRSVTFSVVKIQLVLFDRSNNSGTVNVKMNRSLFYEKPSLRMLEFSISSKLDWVLLLSLLLNCFQEHWRFDTFHEALSFRVGLYLYITTILFCMDNCGHASGGTLICNWEMMKDKLQKQLRRADGLTLADSHKSLVPHRNLTSLSLLK